MKKNKIIGSGVEDRPVIACYGGGTNSTAMLIGMAEKEQRCDLILFADTGSEKPNTYEHNNFFSDWLVENGMPAITNVMNEQPMCKRDGSLENECLRLGVLPSKAYGWGSCSMKWKRDPQDKYIRKWQPAIKQLKEGKKIVKLIGYDAGEPVRINKLLNFQDERFETIVPLFEWDWDRVDCMRTIKRHGLKLPGKSACFFCPSSKKQEIFDLERNYPELANRAVRMEQNMDSHKTKVIGLGRYFSWTELLNEGEQQASFFPESDIDIHCMCYDG